MKTISLHPLLLLMFISIQLAAQSPLGLLTSSKLPKARWLRQKVFDNTIELEVPQGFYRMKERDVRKNKSISIAASRFDGFSNEDQSVIMLYLTKNDFPFGKGGVRFWEFINPYIDFSKNSCKGSGFFNVDGKTVYFIKLIPQREKSALCNFLIFTDYKGKLLYACLRAPAENGMSQITDQIFTNLITSFRFTNNK